MFGKEFHNMGNITLNEISKILELILIFVSSISTLLIGMKTILNKQLKPLETSIQELDINQCKNYLVRFLADVEHKEKLDKVEIERAYEVYDHYTKDLKGNSYIHDKWERLMKGCD